MSQYLVAPLRAGLLTLFLICAGPAAGAGPTGPTPATATARTAAHVTGERPRAEGDGVTTSGVLIIVGIVGAVVLFAWVCSRFGDSRQPTIMR